MCDTLGKVGQVHSFFAKNSDRSPNEVQVLEYYPRTNQQSATVNCTYISVPQVETTYGVLLSRPAWMWGAEMGVNEFGLCIGNEAVFTKGPYGKTGLTGMDMVRLALERSQSAMEALDLLINLLETYGQGGNCGFDHDFYYDNAFLIMDRQELYVLETAGKEWVYKQYDSAAISNRLSIGADGDGYSGGKSFDFRKHYTEPVYTTFSGSAKRRNCSCANLPGIYSVAACMDALRCHQDNVTNPFARGSVSSVCMHYGGLVGDHTTASMVVSLESSRTVVWSTGCSTPCVSLFKPWLFGTEAVLPVAVSGGGAGERYWMEAEAFRRNLLGKNMPESFFAQRDEIQNRWLERAAQISEDEFPAFSKACLEEEWEFFEKWGSIQLAEVSCAPGFKRRWEVKNQVLFAKRDLR